MATQQFKPERSRRYFNRRRLYDSVKWKDQFEAIAQFKAQLEDWYIEPAKVLSRTPHAEFALLALTCILIDTLAQYESGSPKSAQSVFKAWITQHFKSYGRPFRVSIQDASARNGVVENYADAIYVAFRCGILHEAHVVLYGGIAGQKRAVSYHSRGLTTYVNGTECPTIVIDPRRLFKRVHREFQTYFKRMLDPHAQWQTLRDNFKKKFLLSYGIDIDNEP